ncbi:MAG: FAD-dependent oxidoreductase [Chitinophagales bacterium]|nr:FAD-dependent oxidoreductase [Chitinophagales bacterium]
MKVKPFVDLAVQEWSSFREKWKETTELETETSSKSSKVLKAEKHKIEENIKDIFAGIPARRISFQPKERKLTAIGENHSLENIFKGEYTVPDLVIHPINSKEILEVFIQAGRSKVQLFPFITDSVLYQKNESEEKTVCMLKMDLLNKILEFSPEHHFIRLQTGIRIKEVDIFLNAKGFELSQDVTGKEDLTVLDLLHQSNLLYPKIIRAEVLTPLGAVEINKEDALKSLFLQTNQNLGIFSNISLSIRQLPIHERKMSAYTENLETVSVLIKRLHESGLGFDKIRISNCRSDEVFLNATFWNNETLQEDIVKILFADRENKVEEKVLLHLSFAEYEHSLSSTILKTKQTIQKLNGHILSKQHDNSLGNYVENFVLLKEKIDPKEIFHFSFSKTILVEKMSEEEQNISRVIKRATVSTKNKLKYHIQFSKLNYPYIEVEVFVLGRIKNEKDSDIYLTTYKYLHRSMKDNHNKSSGIHEEILAFVKEKTDVDKVLKMRE